MRKKKFISISHLFVQRKTQIHPELIEICRRNVITVTHRACISCISLIQRNYDIRDKLLASPISYLHFITGPSNLYSPPGYRNFFSAIAPRRRGKKSSGWRTGTGKGVQGGDQDGEVATGRDTVGREVEGGVTSVPGWRRDTFLLIPSRTPSSMGT